MHTRDLWDVTRLTALCFCLSLRSIAALLCCTGELWQTSIVVTGTKPEVTFKKIRECGLPPPRPSYPPLFMAEQWIQSQIAEPVIYKTMELFIWRHAKTSHTFIPMRTWLHFHCKPSDVQPGLQTWIAQGWVALGQGWGVVGVYGAYLKA